MILATSTLTTKRIQRSSHGRELATGCRGRTGYAGDLPDNAPAGRRACLSRPASRRTSQITPRQAREHVDAFAQQDALHIPSTDGKINVGQVMPTLFAIGPMRCGAPIASRRVPR
jgi:hypothetical protein